MEKQVIIVNRDIEVLSRIHPPEGPPVCAALNFLPFGAAADLVNNEKWFPWELPQDWCC